jgi:hypothetical protein
MQNSDGAKFCGQCGKPLRMPENRTAQNLSTAQEQGRGSTILLLGILSILVSGLVFGIVAWVMGIRDLKKIGAGIISETERATTLAGTVLGIIGTFARPLLAAIVAVVLFAPAMIP